MTDQIFSDTTSWHEFVRWFPVLSPGTAQAKVMKLWLRVETMKALANHDLQGNGLAIRIDSSSSAAVVDLWIQQ